jgi:hypothetical protein
MSWLYKVSINPIIQSRTRYYLSRNPGYVKILSHIDPSLGNDREKASIQQPLLSNDPTTKHVSTATILLQQERCFLRGPCRDVISRTSEESVSQWWFREFVRERLGFSHCELLLWEHGSWGRRQFGNPEEGWKPLPSNSSEDVIVDTSTCML